MKAEKDLFIKVEDGEELYEMLCEMLRARERNQDQLQRKTIQSYFEYEFGLHNAYQKF